MGTLRIAGGAHFFTDVVFAGIFMFLLIWIFHGLIYRWRLTRISDDTIERPVGRLGDMLGVLIRRVIGRKSF